MTWTPRRTSQADETAKAIVKRRDPDEHIRRLLALRHAVAADLPLDRLMFARARVRTGRLNDGD
jgi:hypothetical protein